jgi:hypothetical protein
VVSLKEKLVFSDKVPLGEIWFLSFKNLILKEEKMKRVMIESPYASETSYEKANYKKYLEACIFDSLERGEAPFASHGFYTQWLKDSDPTERETGMACGRAWAKGSEVVAFYVDYGMSSGMLEMLEWVVQRMQSMATFPKPEVRKLPDWFDESDEEGEA